LALVEFVFLDAAGFFKATWRVWAPTRTPFFLTNEGTVTTLLVGGEGIARMESCTANLLQKGARDPTASGFRSSGFAAGGGLVSAIVGGFFFGIRRESKVRRFVWGGFQFG
jgi:hypothetical protein